MASATMRTCARVNQLSRTNAPVARRVQRQQARSVSAAAHNICVLPGDGIGPEIMAVAVDLLHAAGKKECVGFEMSEHLIGGAGIDGAGSPYPQATEDACKASDAVLLAAIGGYKWDSLPAGSKPENGLLNLRSSLNAYANLRPCLVLDQMVAASTLKEEIVSGVDIMIVRELVGGIYFGKPRGFGTNEAGERMAFNTMVYSEPEIERIAEYAFDIAMKRNRRLCSVDKANVLEVSQLWREVCRAFQVVTRVGERYPDVELSHMYVDNAAMQLIRQPKHFDTIVTGNIFGDILSDAGAMLTGSLGMLPSAAISTAGPDIYEPVHGSAPDIAGKDLANPLAMVLSAAMMCRYGLNEPAIAARLEKAVNSVLDAGFRTGDIMAEGCQQITCSEMGKKLLAFVAEE